MMLHRHFDTAEQPAPIEVPAQRPKKSKNRKSRDEKTAVFIATRNWYDNMVVSAKSLFCNSDVERVFFVIEDDEFSQPLPKEITIINASGSEYFRPDGPNAQSHFSYLCVSRAAYGYILDDHERVLSLDSDLVVVDDISGLWDIDLEGNYCAGVPDLGINRSKYVNAGVILMDLEAMRNDGITQRMINLLNTQHRPWIDQDALNECHDGKVLILPTRYNESPVTGRTANPAIVHYVGVNKTGGSNRDYRHYWDEYAAMTWEQVNQIRTERYGKPLRLTGLPLTW